MPDRILVVLNFKIKRDSNSKTKKKMSEEEANEANVPSTSHATSSSHAGGGGVAGGLGDHK